MNDAKSDYLERKLLDHALGTAEFTMPENVYVGLFTANPTEGGSGAELNGGSYARQVATFDAATTSGGGVTSASNNNELVFEGLPSAIITHVGLFDAQNGGSLLYYGAAAAPKTTGAGDELSIAEYTLKIVEK